MGSAERPRIRGVPLPHVNIQLTLNIAWPRAQHLTRIKNMPSTEAPISAPLPSEVPSSVTIIGMLLDSTRFACALPLLRPRPRVNVYCVPPALLRRNLEAGVTMSTSRVSGSRPPPSALSRPPSKFDFRSSPDVVLLDAFIFALL